MIVRVLVINANVLLREGIKAAILSRRDLQVVGEAERGEDGLNQAIALRPDVAVIDVLLPDMNGMDLTRAITAHSPETRILLFSSHASPTLFQRAADAGASGCVVHDISPADLAGAIRTIHNGGAERRRTLVTGIRRGQGLTSREIDVLRRVAQGESEEKSRRTSPSPSRPSRITCDPCTTNCIFETGRRPSRSRSGMICWHTDQPALHLTNSRISSTMGSERAVP